MNQEYGKCEYCKEETVLWSKTYYYNIECECCSGEHHFETIRFCSGCESLVSRPVWVKLYPNESTYSEQ